MVKYPINVWFTECKYSGSFAVGKRYCTLKKKWVKEHECRKCQEELEKKVNGL
jgi:hypothetical protein